MKYTIFFWSLVVMAAVAAQPLAAQSINLGELQKKEEERRKQVGEVKYVVSDNNIGQMSSGGHSLNLVQPSAEESAEGEAGEGTPAEQEAASETKPKETQQPKYWQDQKLALERRIQYLTENIEKEQLELNQLWTDFYNQSDNVFDQNAVQVKISQLSSSLESKKMSLQQTQAQLEDLYERARQEGVPPGWLR